MKYHSQETLFSCGASALRNCFKYYNHIVSEQRIKQLTHTNKEGTSSDGLINCIDYYNYEYQEIYKRSRRYFKQKLINHLKNKQTVVCLVDSLNHWVAVVGYKNRRIVFIDSEFKKKIKQEFRVNDFLNMCKNYDKYQKKEYYYSINITKKID